MVDIGQTRTIVRMVAGFGDTGVEVDGPDEAEGPLALAAVVAEGGGLGGIE